MRDVYAFLIVDGNRKDCIEYVNAYSLYLINTRQMIACQWFAESFYCSPRIFIDNNRPVLYFFFGQAREHTKRRLP